MMNERRETRLTTREFPCSILGMLVLVVVLTGVVVNTMPQLLSVSAKTK